MARLSLSLFFGGALDMDDGFGSCLPCPPPSLPTAKKDGEYKYYYRGCRERKPRRKTFRLGQNGWNIQIGKKRRTGRSLKNNFWKWSRASSVFSLELSFPYQIGRFFLDERANRPRMFSLSLSYKPRTEARREWEGGTEGEWNLCHAHILPLLPFSCAVSSYSSNGAKETEKEERRRGKLQLRGNTTKRTSGGGGHGMEWKRGRSPPPPLSLPPYSSEAACGRSHPSSSPSLPFSVLLSVS